MAVRSCVEGGAGAPGGHRITGDPTRGCRGGAGRGLRLGAAGAGHDRVRAWRRGTWAALIARRIGRCRPTVSREIRRGAGVGRGLPPGGGAGRGPGALGPPQDPRTGRRPGPARAGRRPARGIGAGPRQIAARLRFENPDDGGMRICHEQIYQALYVQGAGSLRAQLRVEKALRTGRIRRIPRSPLAGEARAQGQELDPGRHPPVCARPGGDEGAVPGHWEADPIIGGDPRQRPDHPGGGVAAGSC